MMVKNHGYYGKMKMATKHRRNGQMSSQRERWTTIKNGNIIEHSENDGYALMRRGFEHHDEIIMSVEEARKQGKYKKLIKEFEESDFKKELIRTN
jgi:hypothetical protein